jgi:hypothetical protein
MIKENDIYTNDCLKILDDIENRKFLAFMSIQSVTDIFYLLRKEYTAEQLREIFLSLSKIVTFIGGTEKILINALLNVEFKDFEDCIQAECAVACGAEYIVTANVKDFACSKIQAITPKQCTMNNVK